MTFKLFDEIMQEYTTIDARDIVSITINDSKLYIENMDGLIFITNKLEVN